jgi:L-cysteine desulfidase
MVKKGRVNVRVAEDSPLLYVRAKVTLDKDYASATIADDHDNIVETIFNGKTLSGASDADEGDNGENRDYKLSVKEIFDFTNTIPYEEIKFILEGRDYNWKLSQEGLERNYGLCVGKTIRENQNSVFGDDFMSYAMGVTAAASDARMAGSTLAAMSNSGSGNQGITVSMPVIAYAKRFDVDDERLARALVLSNLVAIHIKTYLGKLSALCGCVVASTGSACGIVWLEGGNYEQVCAAIKNMIGNITGMVCDGAKVGCAMKVASGVYSSVQSAVLALNGICADENNGIIDRDIEKTIKNLGEIGSVGMKATDEMILKIMSCK